MKKRLLVMFVVLAMIMVMCSGFAFANEDYCHESENGQHDFNYTVSCEYGHPHEGYLECICGARKCFDKMYCEDCEICQRELCKKGIHYYLNKIVYTNTENCAGYGECYCGAKEYFDGYNNTEKSWLAQDVMCGKIQMAHPHSLQEGLASTIGSCDVCQMTSNYSKGCTEYTLYGTCEKDDEEDDLDYDEVESYCEDNPPYEDSKEEDYYYEEDDFYEWLDWVKKT